MSSVLVSKRTSGGISLEEATREFDLLFDEYFEIAQPARLYGVAKATGSEDVLESGGWTAGIYIGI